MHIFITGIAGFLGANLADYYIAKKYGEATGLRVTLIDSKGVVIGESNISKDDLYTMDNHLQRPEIQIADSLESGSITRYSETLKVDFIYLAKKVELKEIKYIRIAQEMALVNILLEKRQLQQTRWFGVRYKSETNENNSLGLATKDLN